ncbi:MAG: Undecaprenyl-phosphate 4-deoxy-4-formamido-L-arabinose transferase [Chlamydiales bacterium]|nr:Undecaprenyl-phosphate 4-deoxy-4-formamido-L-arabinose transferase [Chlamydiales bacterium]
MLSTNPKLSIIISCYNYAHFLKESIDSILKQDYTDYELILIDDGSSDTTWEILQTYQAQNSSIRIFQNHVNQGLFAAYKSGWREAKGEYIHFFSADDVYRPSCLSKMMRLFEKNPQLRLVCTDIEYFQKNSQKTTKLLDNQTEPQIYTPKEMVPLFELTNFWVPGLTCIVKNETLKKHGYLDPKLENISDWYCFHKIALFEGIGYIPEPLIAMRLHDETYTARVKRNKKRKRATYVHLLNKLLKEKQTCIKFKQAGLLHFVSKELKWRCRLNPRYWGFR